MKLAVFFPGIGYRFDKPLLYYSKKLAAECGFDTILEVDYQIKKTKNIRGNEEKMQQAYQEACQNGKQFLESISWEDYEDVVFVSKSIGTAVAAHFANHYQRKIRQIYYTPLAQTFLANPTPGIAFSGTADPWVPDVESLICQCQKSKIETHRIEGANHSLEVADTMENLKILQEVMEKSREYLQRK